MYAQAYGEAECTVEVADYLQQGAIMVEYLHRPAEAEEMLRRAIKIYLEAGMPQAEAQAERNLANVLGYWDARGAEGAPHYRRALELMEAAQGRESIDAEVEASLGILGLRRLRRRRALPRTRQAGARARSESNAGAGCRAAR